MESIQTIETPKRGGKRDGAGRKGLSYWIRKDPRYLRARGIDPLYAAEVLSHVVDESRIWKRILSTEDDRVLLDAMKFLVSMRDGRPAQQINVTSKSITMNLTDLERAKAIIAEIRAEANPIIGQLPAAPDSSGADIMLSGDDGAEKGGM